MSGIVLGRLNDFLMDADGNSFDFERFKDVCNEAIAYLKNQSNAGDERHILISSLASSMIVFKTSIPDNEFNVLWDRVEATFNPTELMDSDLRELVDRMIWTSH